MDEFEAHRPMLFAVAYRMLGSVVEAEDAVQDAWLRYARADVTGVDNLAGWLRTVVSRICLDALRARAARREEPVDEVPDFRVAPDVPEAEAELAESVGRALLVVLDRLAPDERVAFVLHDLFAVPFAQIALIVERSPATAKKVASRARGRMGLAPDGVDSARDALAHKDVVTAFLAAARGGDLEALVALLAPDVVRRFGAAEVRGVLAVAGEIAAFAPWVRFAEFAVVDGGPGAVVAPIGRVVAALEVTVRDGLVTEYRITAGPRDLARLRVVVGN
ncbi:sigma-70 family RNA polymerase sigma factor [Actinokineospora auranticolor]|uniref:RNA polymerase sigma-70 factor (ECF subfamily) n=1 Tax=Actinokineospora auranticolor TaxID=155976 RepID=A0A2S6GDJ1_9PSEU|nr:sigma-70 family RNA polymerase sigma factor [Actinokineospora auranticolor]PPK63270.1 RNA polymerase sigma-70 factor (ECF subfamily) [Actinokineospora auranticolor]